MKDEKAPEATGRAELQAELPTHKQTVAGNQGSSGLQGLTAQELHSHPGGPQLCDLGQVP